MKISLQSLGAVILTWIGLMILLFVHAFFGRQLTTQLVYSCYMLTISFLLVELFEKRSIVERFGFQRNSVLGLVVAVCLGFILAWYLGLEYLTGVISAPMVEELYFRGYMLGAFNKLGENHEKWRLSELVWILFSSLLFTLSHILKYYPTFPSSTGSLLFSLFFASLVLGFLYIRSGTILWSFLVHMLYNLASPFGINETAFYLLAASSTIIILTYLLKHFLSTRKNHWAN